MANRLQSSIAELSFRGHLRATWGFGLPLVGAQLAGIAIGVTDTVMVGWLGAAELGAVALASQFYFVLWIMGAGLTFAVIPLASSARGAGDARKVRRWVRMGLWLVALYSVIAMIPMWYAQDILLALGQSQETATLSGIYMRVVLWAMFPALLAIGLRAFLTVLECAQIVLWATILGALLNGVLNYAFIFGNFGAPEMGIAGAGIASICTNIFIVVVMVAYIYYNKETRSYDIFGRIWRADWEAFFEIFRLGWPISAGLLAETGLFTATSVMMGWLGTIPLAAHGIALQMAAVAFMIPLGISNAGTVRVGNHLGRQDPVGLGYAGYATIVIAGLLSGGCAVVLLIFPEWLVSQFLVMSNPESAEVLAYAVPLLLIAAAFQLFDGLQVVGLGVLRGLKDTKVPMYIAVFSYWCVGVPVAYLLAIVAGLGGVGVWTGLAIGLFVAAGGLIFRFVKRDYFGLVPR